MNMETTPEQAPTDNEVIQAMRVYGGSFVQQLGLAAGYADEDNLQLIKSTWPQYWEEYSDLARISRGPRNDN